ncbi:MAG: polyphosphate kinase [Zymomonas mobilis]|uniref:Polyphosphate kinase 2 (PPK2 family) n=1 Tax=Zymomonas mobilis TaxID=542 RepID=A0A542W0P6_ZYMMB|nr:polyphosphate kinase [Zymomonas mobilis]TQL17162.1 polyphosphate kinase 2 (PPK2 family) [Zymomonas mobilis]
MSVNLADYEQATPFKGDYDKTLAQLQKRLAHILVAYIVYRQKAIILFEGQDSSGKSGIIQRLISGWDPRHFRVWPIGVPTEEEKSRHFLWRFWSKMPANGEVSIFDRSWYGRVLVERVDKLATDEEWQRSYDEINEFESLQCENGTKIIKIFCHITAKTQDERFKRRLDHPWKHVKISVADFHARDKRDEYKKAFLDMFDQCSMHWAPWHIIDANDKPAARIHALTLIADELEKNLPTAPPPVDPEIIKLAKEKFGIDIGN